MYKTLEFAKKVRHFLASKDTKNDLEAIEKMSRANSIEKTNRNTHKYRINRTVESDLQNLQTTETLGRNEGEVECRNRGEFVLRAKPT